MQTEYFTANETLFEITERFPETIPVFVSNGFTQMNDPVRRREMGSRLTLTTAALLKGHRLESLIGLLQNHIRQTRESVDITLSQKSHSSNRSTLQITGLLPCPVRLPLLEQFDQFIRAYSAHGDAAISYDLRSASSGVDWVHDIMKGSNDPSTLPDLFLSAGFDLFFDASSRTGYSCRDIYQAAITFPSVNPLFRELALTDPQGHYSIIALVPAIFVVNLEELGALPVPRTWSDILSPAYHGNISLPVGDFDLFNGLLLNIYKRFGEDGIQKIGSNLSSAMHPAQMIKTAHSHGKNPAVTIMPYFFSRMIRNNTVLKPVWPEDGAIVSPIFMIAKKEKYELLQPITRFLGSRSVGEILAHQGLFPSLHPDVDNQLPEHTPFIWLGWDFIYSNDIPALITRFRKLFDGSRS